jgi:hypothetical protein
MGMARGVAGGKGPIRGFNEIRKAAQLDKQREVLVGSPRYDDLRNLSLNPPTPEGSHAGGPGPAISRVWLSADHMRP